MVTAIRQQARPDVEFRFLAFSLDQAHAAEGEPPVWERAPGERGGGVAALEWGIAVRDTRPDLFLDAHEALFAARHVNALRLDDEATLRDAVRQAGLDPDSVAAEVATGRPLATLAAEHEECRQGWEVFGAPTFIEGDEAAFVRIMRPGALAELDRVLGLLGATDLNEFKRTRLPR